MRTARWSDLLIVSVGYDQSGSHIGTIGVRIDLGNNTSSVVKLNRDDAIFLLDDGLEMETAFKDKETGNLRRGAKVHPIRVGSKAYLRTDRNSVAADNLGNLPTH